MFSSIPLPNMNQLTIPAKLAELNELQKQKLENDYYPQNAIAKNASQLAYASLVGPQFIAKLMGNPDILANIHDEKKGNVINSLFRAGIGASGSNAFNQPTQDSDSFSGFLTDKFKNLFGSSNNSLPNKNALAQQPMLSSADRNAMSSMQPGDSYVIQGNQSNDPLNMIPRQQKSFAENAGEFQGSKEEGKEAGKIRANDIKDLNDHVFNAETQLTTLNDLSDIVTSPDFRNMRQLALVGNHEIGYYANFGTPEQKKIVGRLITDTGNIIKDSARDFPGQFRKGEQQLMSNMKVNPGDMPDTAIGKLQSLTYFTKMLHDRSRLTSEIMSQYHVNKLQASEVADSKINGDEIRQQIGDRLNPTFTIKNKKTGETKTVSAAEARKLGVPNV